jgi:hypothetical protein
MSKVPGRHRWFGNQIDRPLAQWVPKTPPLS